MKLHHGDNLEFMRTLPKESIDLIYIDPPFFTQRDFGQFNDRWKDLNSFVGFLERRIIQCHRLLKNTGVFCLHLDWRSVHYLKVKCDEIFGYENFVNEIIWEHSTSDQRKSGNYKKTHETILLYSKTKKFYSKPDRGPLADTTLSRFKNCFNKKGEVTVGTVKEKQPGFYNLLLKQGRVRSSDSDDKILLSKNKGAPIGNVWRYKAQIGKRTKGVKTYPTMKPLAMLERIVRSYCPEKGVVADFFCGSGTTLVAAKNLGRQYIGSDISEEAIRLTRERLGQ